MFADPFSNLMLIVLLFFAGLLVMFIFMMRSIDGNWRNQEETRRQLALSLSDLERKVNELGALLRGEAAPAEEPSMPEPEARPATQYADERRLPELSLFAAAEPAQAKPDAPAARQIEPAPPLPDLLIGMSGTHSNDSLEIMPSAVPPANAEADLGLFPAREPGEEESSPINADTRNI